MALVDNRSAGVVCGSGNFSHASFIHVNTSSLQYLFFSCLDMWNLFNTGSFNIVSATKFNWLYFPHM